MGRTLELTVHHDHQQVGRVPPYASVDLLTGCGGDQSAKTNQHTSDPVDGHGADDIVPLILCVTGEVTAVGHTGCLLTNGLVDARHHKPRDAPARTRRDALALVENGADTLCDGE